MTTAVVITPHNLQNLARNGAPGRIRTCDPRLRRPPVYRGATVGLGLGNRLSMAVIFCVPRTVHIPRVSLKKEGIGLRGPLRR